MPMSYTVTVKSSGGELSVTSSGDVPDGTFGIAGHEEASYGSLAVTRTDAGNREVIMACARASKGE